MFDKYRFERMNKMFNSMVCANAYVNGILCKSKEYCSITGTFGYRYDFSHFKTHRKKHVIIMEAYKPNLIDKLFKVKNSYVYIEDDKHYIGISLLEAFTLLNKVQNEMFYKEDKLNKG